MLDEPRPAWRRGGTWCAVAVAALVLPGLAAPAGGLVVAATAALVVVAAILRWPVGPLSLTAAGGAAAVLSLAVDVLYPGVPGMALIWLPFELGGLLVLTGRVVRAAPAGALWPAGGALVAAALLLPLRFAMHTTPPKWGALPLGALIMAVPVAIAVGVGGYLRSLDGRRIEAVRTARAAQRLEVARDLHDFVAHEVTGIVLEAQATQVADFDEPAARAAFARVEQAGLRALESMDRTVRALREPGRAGDEAPPRLYALADVEELVRRFSAGGAVHAELVLDAAALGRLRPEAEATGYTVVLEALTNVRRHAASARSVWVGVLAREDAVEVVVRDDGGPPAGLTRDGGGTGLAGLAERVATLDGSLTAGPDEHGWRVRAELPVPDVTGYRARRSG